MSTVDVRSIQALLDLRTALLRYGADAAEVLEHTERELRRTQEWLLSRRQHWQTQVRRWQEEVRGATLTLERCQASGSYDSQTGRRYVPDCSGPEQMLRQAQTRLREVEAELANTLRWERAVEEATVGYRKQAQRLAGTLQRELPAAAGLLERKAAALHAYAATGLETQGSAVTAREGAAQGAAQSVALAGSAEDVARLQLAFASLCTVTVGESIAAAIAHRSTAVRFGAIGEGDVALYYSERNEIVLNEQLGGAPAAVLAAHLAHEGTHAQWNRRNSIDQEYHAFRAEAEVWNTLKGDLKDGQCDWVSSMIARGEREAKDIIRRYYNLPEYA